MAILRLDHVSVIVEDLDAAIAFFEELGMAVEGRTPIEGAWVDQLVGLDGTRTEIAMLVTPDGHGRLELTRFDNPPGVRPEPGASTANALGFRNVMFAVDDIDATVARLERHGAEVVRAIARFEDAYRLCYLRGPEGILVALAEPLT
ncbi:VOC family protein [Demequina iriomotensis]|uniref:VOC family protein n=1 Tax=Demequina iriomotensis TaxID=1536641 RepID=UPI0007849368|nr:VOC family protein [Demequina iriomotensis]